MPPDGSLDPDAVFLWHIQRACRQLESYLDGVAFEKFSTDPMLKDAVFWKINVIGEAVGSLSEEFREKHDGIPWRKARAVRNRIVHGYDTIDDSIIWDTATVHIPKMLKQIVPLLPAAPTEDE